MKLFNLRWNSVKWGVNLCVILDNNLFLGIIIIGNWCFRCVICIGNGFMIFFCVLLVVVVIVFFVILVC